MTNFPRPKMPRHLSSRQSLRILTVKRKGTLKMVDKLVRTIVEHPKRKILVIILTFVTGVVFVLPAVEEYSAAQARQGVAREKLNDASGAAANLPLMQAALQKKKNE